MCSEWVLGFSTSIGSDKDGLERLQDSWVIVEIRHIAALEVILKPAEGNKLLND